jgi:AraC-like DNA-binding protein
MTKLSTDDIANLVGFGETSNFRRAFKRWTGKVPSDYR